MTVKVLDHARTHLRCAQWIAKYREMDPAEKKSCSSPFRAIPVCTTVSEGKPCSTAYPGSCFWRKQADFLFICLSHTCLDQVTVVTDTVLLKRLARYNIINVGSVTPVLSSALPY